MALLVRDLQTSTAYEASTLFFSSLVTAMAVPFYIVAAGHSQAKPYERASSMTSNSIVNFYVTKVSLDYLSNLIREKKYGKIAVVLLLSAIANAPSGFITASESTYSKSLTICVGASTSISGIFLSSYAIGAFPSLYLQLKMLITKESASEEKINVLANLSEIMRRVRVADYVSQTLSCVTEDELLSVSVRLAKTVKNPYVVRESLLFDVLKWSLQFAVSLLLLYGNISYTCMTEESIRNDFYFSPILSAVLANITMVFSYVMSVNAGFSLVSSVFDYLSVLNYRAILPSECKLGGKVGTIFAAASPFLAGFIASSSGVTSKTFSKSCSRSALAPLTFPHFDTLVMYSSRIFNGVYVAMAFMWFIGYCVARKGAEQDKAYLFVLKSLTDLYDRVQAMSNDEVAQYEGGCSLTEEVGEHSDTLSDQLLAPALSFHALKIPKIDFTNRFFYESEDLRSSVSSDMGRVDSVLNLV